MKINTVNAGEIDTDKMDDLKALITEKSNELYKICADNNIMCLIAARNIITTFHMKSNDCPLHASVNFFWDWINFTIGHLSGGSLFISFIPKGNQPPPVEGEEWKKSE